MANTTKKTQKKSTIVRLCGFVVCQLFCVVSLVYFAIVGDMPKAFMAAASVTFVFVPDIIQRLFRFRASTPLYFAVLLYTVCPLLGFSYKFYYRFGWWDDVLHLFAGVVFALFGAYMAKILNGKYKCSVLLCAVFGFVFSVTIASLWEFVEYGMDTFFGTDMQKDVLLTSMRPSYLLGQILGLPIDQMGMLGAGDGVLVNGALLDGYLDVGLIDTMHDLLVETLGALIYAVAFLIGKGKYFTLNSHPISTVPNEP